MRAFEVLDHNGLLEFLGVRESGGRATVYRELRTGLSQGCRDLWDSAPNAIRDGVIHCGRFERYMRWFRHLLPRGTRAAIEQLTDVKGADERRSMFDEQCDGHVWRALTAVAFAPRTISMFDRRRPYLERASADVVSAMRRRLRHGLTVAPWRESPYLTYFLTGNFSDGALPRYLRPEHHHAIQSRIGRISIHHSDLADARALGLFSGFNLSNVFDYVDRASLDTTYSGVLAAAEPTARIAYWSAFTDRQGPVVSQRVMSGYDATLLRECDAVGAYESFHIDEVCAPA
ncbi:MAG: DUF3419 family protein [Acidobacteria bacterium]|nr:DUF3419 family protein [Acidobacteriota bacterium]